MEDVEKKGSSAGKSVFSIVLLLGLLLLLMYAAPMLQDKLSEVSKEEELQDTAGSDTADEPQISPALVDWLPLVMEQLPSLEDGTPKYRLLHMRLSADENQLLLDLTEGEGGDRFDVILQHDEFGRYISQHADIPLKIYPPE